VEIKEDKAMKKLFFIMVCLAAIGGTTTIRAQSYSAEEWQGDKMIGKIWVSQKGKTDYKSRGLAWGGLGFEYSKGDTALTITRMDSAKVFNLNPKTKTYSVGIDFSVMLKGGANIADLVNSQGGGRVMKNSDQVRKLLGNEDIEGFECNHYSYTTTTTLSNGQTETTVYENWIYEPLGVEMQRKDAGQYDRAVTLKNFKQGPQPDALFEIPKDYKRASGDTGDLQNMLDMMQGKGKAGEAMKQNVQQQDELKKKQDAIKNDPNKSEQQKIMELLNQMGGGQKKK
jgi:hypothetical protein